MIRKSGFTLAEVLVTLGIIGVVAAMTIPTLVNQTNDAEYKTGLKKAVSVLNQAVTMNYAMHNVDFGEISDASKTADGDASMAAILKNRLNVINDNPTATEAPMKAVTSMTTVYTLNDGMQIGFTGAATACTKSAPCELWVDLNGPKKPNAKSTAYAKGQGTVRDIYMLYAYDQTVIPGDGYAAYIMYGVDQANGDKITPP